MSLQTRIKAAGAAAAAAPVDAGRRRAVKRRTKRAVMDRMGYDEVARISAYIDPALARSELRPAVEAALNVEEPTDLATSSARPSSTRFWMTWWAWGRCSRSSRTTPLPRS